MMMNKEQVRKHFDKHAHEYDQYARIQGKMAHELVLEIQDRWGKTASTEQDEKSINQQMRILEIGCGTGNVTRLLLDIYPHSVYTAVDLSEAMIRRTKEKLSTAAECVKWIVGDAEAVITEQSYGLDHRSENSVGYDLIVSNATFQWFNEPAKTVKGLLALLNAGGCLAFSTFGPETFRELHASFLWAQQQLKLPVVRHGQPFIGQASWEAMIEEAGQQLEWSQKLSQEYHLDVHAFLQSVKRVGASNANEGQTFLGKALIKSMAAYYKEHYGNEIGIPATYDTLYGWVHKQN
jgi:malonyl-CoA O-methyltransferase